MLTKSGVPTNRALTKDEKIAVIQRGMARLPAMGVEAVWAFGAPTKTDFIAPPIWVQRVILMRFNVDPGKSPSGEKADPLQVSKMLGFLFGLAEGAEIVFRLDKSAQTDSNTTLLDEEKLKKSVRDAASPHHAKFDKQAQSVRRSIREGTAEQYAAFTAGQSEVAKVISEEEKEPGSTTDMTQDILTFLWMFWPEIALTGSVHKLHQWITNLGYLHCSEDLVEKVCRKAELRISPRGQKKRIPTK